MLHLKINFIFCTLCKLEYSIQYDIKCDLIPLSLKGMSFEILNFNLPFGTCCQFCLCCRCCPNLGVYDIPSCTMVNLTRSETNDCAMMQLEKNSMLWKYTNSPSSLNIVTFEWGSYPTSNTRHAKQATNILPNMFKNVIWF